jgi:Cu2+-exporting ATPase
MSGASKTITLPVTGMSCAACATSVQSLIGAQPGVDSAEVNYAAQSAKISYHPDTIRPERFKEVVQSIGYDLILDESASGKVQQQEDQQKRYLALRKRLVFAGALTLPVVVIGMFFMDLPRANWYLLAFTTPVLFVFGRSFFINAYKQARHGIANMDTLVALSTGIAYLFSLFNTLFPEVLHHRGLHPHVYYEAAAVVIVFIMLGKLLEERAKATTSSAIRKLIGLQPKTVRRLTGEEEREIPLAEVQQGDRIVIRPGERIPVDGRVYEGSSYVDESMITGEPVAAAKSAGCEVLAGTINQSGSFRFTAEKVGGETMLSRIIQLVAEAQSSKAPVQKLTDRIAAVFVPSVVAIALGTLLLWLIFGGGQALTQGLLSMVTVLVIACPCALGLATPTAIMVGIGKGAGQGILIRDAAVLESGDKINAIIFDKTGTLTVGKPEVAGLRWLTAPGDQKLREIFLALERQSGHPLAEAIVSKLSEEEHLPVMLTDFESLSGKGVTARFEGKRYAAGSQRLMIELNIPIPAALAKATEEPGEQAKTIVWFASEEEVLAVAAITDRVKPGSKEAVDELNQSGVEVYMLTGDNPQTAAAVAHQTGIRQFVAEMLPSEKADFVTKLQARGKTVAMIGDGINDSLALARADVSIAMGHGSDIAIDTAKITLINPDLRQVPKALRLSRATVKTIRQNLFWAFIYNIAGIPVAAGILYPFTGFLLNPMIAGAAMALSSVSVVANSLRLRMTA